MEGVFMPRPIKDLVILGLGQSCVAWPSLVAREPEFTGEIWTINAGALSFRHDAVFDMHTEEYIHAQVDTKVSAVRPRFAARRSGWRGSAANIGTAISSSAPTAMTARMIVMLVRNS